MKSNGFPIPLSNFSVQSLPKHWKKSILFKLTPKKVQLLPVHLKPEAVRLSTSSSQAQKEVPFVSQIYTNWNLHRLIDSGDTEKGSAPKVVACFFGVAEGGGPGGPGIFLTSVASSLPKHWKKSMLFRLTPKYDHLLPVHLKPEAVLLSTSISQAQKEVPFLSQM
ncbi:hypothetical protein SDC9_120578 [bioreactor metagenome]|uniref:Uncharacterized protein n=1 Tax=bioreactor metagenome TaxID=1076179 RepID=A0A645C736_9ZZZZ